MYDRNKFNKRVHKTYNNKNRRKTRNKVMDMWKREWIIENRI